MPVDTTRIFISYHSKSSQEAVVTLEKFLRTEPGYDVWRDEASIPAGSEWRDEISANLFKSDIYLLVVGAETGSSEWVRREAEIALYFNVTPISIGYSIDEDTLLRHVRTLGLADYQYIDPLPDGVLDDEFDERARKKVLDTLRPAITRGKDETARKQRDNIGKLLKQLGLPKQHRADDNPHAHTFTFPTNGRTVTIYVAAGDMAMIRGVDAFVNSENTFMQMARTFERRSISSMLRNGALVQDENGWQDIVQEEINAHLRGQGRPIQPRSAIVTAAGLAQSPLVRSSGARYIFHVAAVQATEGGRFEPFQEPHQIRECVSNCLHKIVEVDGKQGVVSPPETRQHAEQVARKDKGYTPIKHIMLPLFGTGQGQVKDTKEVVRSMAQALRDELLHNTDLHLETIYFSAFSQENVADVCDVLGEFFNVVKPEGA